MSAPITLKGIWNSSTDLLKRFDLIPTFDAAWTKVVEEEHETVESLYKLTINKDRRQSFLFRSHLAKEAADCLVTLLNAAYTVGMTEADLRSVPSLNTLWSNIETDSTQRRRLMDLSLSLYPFYSVLMDVRSGDNMATRDDIALALARCIAALMGVVKGAGLSYDEFEAAIEAVMYKNGRKDKDSHEVIESMIVKRKPVIESEAQ